MTVGKKQFSTLRKTEPFAAHKAIEGFSLKTGGQPGERTHFLNIQIVTRQNNTALNVPGVFTGKPGTMRRDSA